MTSQQGPQGQMGAKGICFGTLRLWDAPEARKETVKRIWGDGDCMLEAVTAGTWEADRLPTVFGTRPGGRDKYYCLPAFAPCSASKAARLRSDW